MKTRYIFILAAMALLASCAKEIQAPEENPADELQVKTVLTVGINQDTKTTLGNDGSTTHKVYWSDGDKIAVNGTASDALSGIAAETQSTKFTFSGTLSTPYNVLYPAAIYTNANHVTLPAIQDYEAAGFADGMFPMAGYSASGSDVTLSHLCAIVKVSVKQSSATDADKDDIVAVRFKGKNGEKVNGEFEIDYTVPALAAAPGSGNELEVKVVERQATSTGLPVDYYIVVPARNYANGFEITVQDASGHIMKKSSKTDQTLVAGKLYSMPALTFVPTATELGIEISNAAELIAFAQAFNNKEYGEDVVATITADITFDATSSAQFNTTHGIGQKKNIYGATEDNYFSGVFNGGNFTISGLDATVPIFAYTQTGSLIEDLTLDNSCTYTVNSPDADPNHGAFVGRHKGTLKNCTSNANMTINNIEDVNTVAQHYGGLVGRNYGGTIDGCTMGGDIICSQAETITKGTDLAAYVGGIAGTLADNGSVNNCSFTGNITISNGDTYGGITAAGTYFYVAGIAGYAENGIISECTTGIDGTATAIDVRGSFVPAVGGILAWSKTATDSEIRDCNNYAALSVSVNGARADTTPLRVGGIAARSAATIKNSNNSGAISSVSNSTTVYLGGIVADGTNVSNCINNTGGTITRTNGDASDQTQTNRYMFIGGIMGGANASGDITGCKNYAAVLSNAIGTATQTTIDMGGILGCTGINDYPYQIDILSCENNGTVTLTNNGTVVTSRLTIGGILGYAHAANSTIKSCDNKAQIYCNSQQNKAGRASYSGGIVGLMGIFDTGLEGLEIDNCTNSARVWNRNYNNTVTPASSTPFGGGIVGAIIGKDGSQAYIHDCSTSGGDVVELRGYSGGIAGYAEKAIIKNNTVAQALTGSNANSQGVGGIVGWAVSSSITSCSTSGNINAVKNIGGLVAKLDTGSSINDCKVDGATLTNGTNGAATAAAVLVSVASAGVNISKCGVKGTINGAAITLSSNMITTNGGAIVTDTYLIP